MHSKRNQSQEKIFCLLEISIIQKIPMNESYFLNVHNLYSNSGCIFTIMYHVIVKPTDKHDTNSFKLLFNKLSSRKHHYCVIKSIFKFNKKNTKKFINFIPIPNFLSKFLVETVINLNLYEISSEQILKYRQVFYELWRRNNDNTA